MLLKFVLLLHRKLCSYNTLPGDGKEVTNNLCCLDAAARDRGAYVVGTLEPGSGGEQRGRCAAARVVPPSALSLATRSDHRAGITRDEFVERAKQAIYRGSIALLRELLVEPDVDEPDEFMRYTLNYYPASCVVNYYPARASQWQCATSDVRCAHYRCRVMVLM